MCFCANSAHAGANPRYSEAGLISTSAGDVADAAAPACARTKGICNKYTMAVCSHQGCWVTGLRLKVIHLTCWKKRHDQVEERASMMPVFSINPSSEAINSGRRWLKSQLSHPNVRFVGGSPRRCRGPPQVGPSRRSFSSRTPSYHPNPDATPPWGPCIHTLTKSRKAAMSPSAPTSSAPHCCSSARAMMSSKRTSGSMKKESQSIHITQSCSARLITVSTASTFDHAAGLCEIGSPSMLISPSSKTGAFS
mmetsp:Transcript_71800/g.207997  ORF Transcript_71800/g.207997 Transcript_71800/m.207997 type:complete len:251 (-) Transcript_71800:754-1506(-)